MRSDGTWELIQWEALKQPGFEEAAKMIFQCMPSTLILTFEIPARMVTCLEPLAKYSQTLYLGLL